MDSIYNFNETPRPPKVSAKWIPDLIAEKQITIAGSNVSSDNYLKATKTALDKVQRILLQVTKYTPSDIVNFKEL